MTLPQHGPGVFKRAAAVGLASLIATMPFANAANAAGKASTAAQCAPLYQTSTGRDINASYSAFKYSQDNIGAVGISIFPGADSDNRSAHKLGHILRSTMEKYGVEAECFIHNEPGPNGTAVNFKIAGLSWKENGSLNISQSLNKDTLRSVIAEAKTARDILGSGNKPVAALN